MSHDVQQGLPNRYYDNRDDFLGERAKIFSPMWVRIGFANKAELRLDLMGVCCRL